MKKGFTLIELLVVVLIIGILVAVALPQYQRAILKSRFNALKSTADAIRTAQEMYYMEHGSYASSIGTLDIQVPQAGQDTTITFSDITDHDYVQASKTSLPHNRYTMYLAHSKNFAGNIYCEALTGDEQANALCIAEGGKEGPVNGNYTLYLLAGNSTGAFSKYVKSESNDGYRYTAEDGSYMEVFLNSSMYYFNYKDSDGKPKQDTEMWNRVGTRYKNGITMYFCEEHSDLCDLPTFCTEDFPSLCTYR